MFENLLLIAHLVMSVAIIVLVLLQQGKGAQAGAAFGGGSSQSLFGSRGSSNFLTKATSVIVTVFFLTTLSLAYIYTHRDGGGSVVGGDGVLSGSILDAVDDPAAAVDGVIKKVTVGAGAGADDGEAADVPEVPAEDGLAMPVPTVDTGVPQLDDVPSIDAASDAPNVPE